MASHEDGPEDLRFEEGDVQRLIALLSRDDVRQLNLAAAANPQGIRGISRLPAPAGMTSDDAVDLITALNRASAAYSPIPDREGRMHWYVCTRQIRAGLSEIDRYCTVDSSLYRATEQRAGARFLIQANVDEAIATAQLSGVDVDYAAAKDLLLMQRHPRDWKEQLLVNQYRLTEQLAEMVDRPWTPETMLELYAHLTRGLPSDMLSGNREDWPEREAVLRGVCAYAERPISESCEHPAVSASIIRAVVGYWKTFPRWNGMMSRIVMRLYALKAGYPVLGYIPVSRAERDWAAALEVQDLDSARESHLLDRWQECDSTAWLSAHVSLMIHALRQFRRQMERAEVIDAAVREELQNDQSLNHRQRSIIGRALRVPDATFRIAYHRTTHGIGYATAYRDFAALVEQGYLVEENQGRLKVFRAGPRLEQRIGALQDVGRVEDFRLPLPQDLGWDPGAWRHG